MTKAAPFGNRVRDHRLARGWTQEELARRAGISRTAVTAIESARLVPSVAAALALATALGETVETLFGSGVPETVPEVWAWEPADHRGCWRAEVAGRTIQYPAASLPQLTPIPDPALIEAPDKPRETLVLAGCDPAAGLLASRYAQATGWRLLVLPRSSRQSLDLLGRGLVHLAGLHLSTADEPDRNQRVVRETLGPGYRLTRIADWHEGIATLPARRLKSTTGRALHAMSWVGRESGSGARQCLDRLLGDRSTPRRVAGDHRGVVEAVRAGWADAGVCVQLSCIEAGLAFLPVQREAYDVCYPASLADDRRLKAFLEVVRSVGYRRLLATLPGYDVAETGATAEVS